MDKIKRLFKNIGVMGLSTVINVIFSLILTIFYARYLGDVGFGKYAFALSFTSLFSVLGDLGLGILAVREIAIDSSGVQKYLRNVMAIKIIVGGFIFVLICTIISKMNYPRDTTVAVYILGIGIFVNLVTSGIRWCFQAFQVLEYDALITSLLGLLRLLGGIAVLMTGKGIIELALVDMGANGLVLILSYLIISKRFVKVNIEFDLTFWKKLLISSSPLALILIFSTIYLNIDTVMLSTMKGDAATGWYKAAYKLVGVVRLVPTFFIPAVFPVMSELFSKSRKKFIQLGEKALLYLIAFCLPLCLGTTLVADKVIYIFFGNRFVNSIIVLQVLIWTSLFMFISQVTGHMLIAAGRQKIVTYAVGIGLIFNIFFNLILIPKFSYIGAAISIFIAEFIVASLDFFFAYKTLSFSPAFSQFFKLLISSLVMSIITYLVRSSSIMIIIFLSVSVYLSVLIILRSVKKEDRVALKDIIIH